MNFIITHTHTHVLRRDARNTRPVSGGGVVVLRGGPNGTGRHARAWLSGDGDRPRGVCRRRSVKRFVPPAKCVRVGLCERRPADVWGM